MESTKRQIKKAKLQEAGITHIGNVGTVGASNARHQKEKLQQAGITLVALVVTIIVLLILAGVTITLALGNNGVIGRAQQASNTWSNATKDEETAMGQFASDVDTLTEGFISREGTQGGGSGGSGGGNQGTTIKIGDTDLSTAVANLKTNEALKGYYGQTVSGFSANSTTQLALDTEGITWQLFYDDADNYYLITSNYVPGSTLPSELLTDEQYTTYCRKFATSLSDTTSAIPSGTEWSKASSASTVQNNPYLKWVGSSYDNKSNKYINMKAVAYMMDTDVWSEFAGGVGTAIGGPTVEMLSLSWNAVADHTSKMTSYATLSDSNANSYGYKANSPETSSYFFGTATNMWFIKESTNARAYWLASPSSSFNYYVRGVSDDGRVSDAGFAYTGSGFRPVVSIQKS